MAARRRAGLRVEQLESRDVPDGALAGTFFDDADGDNIQDVDEPGVAGIVVKARNWWTFEVMGQATSDANGEYEITGLPAGYASVEITIPGTMRYSFSYPGDNNHEYWASPEIPENGTANVSVAVFPDPVVSVSALYPTLVEGETGVFRFTRTGYAGMYLSVDYTLSGTASNGTDYGVTGTAMFEQGMPYVDLEITANTGTTSESPETVTLTLDDVATYLPDEEYFEDTLTIIDPPPTVSVAATADAKEGDTNGTFTFTRTGSLTSSLTVGYTVLLTGPSMANPGGDYAALSGSVTFAPNSATATVTVDVMGQYDDNVREPDEAVQLRLDDVTGYTVTSANARVWITDDDGGRVIWVAPEDGNWDNPDNWDIGRVPEAGDDVYFLGDSTAAASIGASVYSNYPMLSFASITSAQTYASLHVLRYTSLINLTVPVTVETLELRSDATLDQPNGSSSDLTVTKSMHWTKGTINSADSGANLNIQGALATVEPEDQGTVTLGSTLNVTLGAAVSFFAGTICFVGGTGICIQEGGVDVRVDSNSTVTFEKTNPGPQEITLNHAASYYRVNRTEPSGVGIHYTKLPFGIDRGVLSLNGGVHLDIAPRAPGSLPDSVYITGGTLALQGGSTLVAPNGVLLEDDKAEIRVGINATGTRADIVGDVKVNFGQVIISSSVPYGQAAPSRGSLRVLGHSTLSAGVFLTFFNPVDATSSYLWEATGTFTVHDSAKLRAHPFDAQANTPPTPGLTWRMIKSPRIGGHGVGNAFLPTTGTVKRPDYSITTEPGTLYLRKSEQ